MRSFQTLVGVFLALSLHGRCLGAEGSGESNCGRAGEH